MFLKGIFPNPIASLLPCLLLLPAVGLLLALSGCGSDGSDLPLDHTGWKVYGGDKGGSRYSSLDEINRSNVDCLEVAWTLRTGDHRTDPPSTIECSPIVIDGTVYLTSPQLKLMAVDAVTGQEIWRFDPDEGGVSRGVTYWERPDGTGGRIFYGVGSNLYAVDARSGTLVSDFGDGGALDLHEGLGEHAADLHIGARSPGIIYGDLLIMGSNVSEGPGPAAPGHIRAFNAETGALEWVFHTIPQEGEVGYNTWGESGPPASTGGANAWAGLALDEVRGIVFAPTGSPTYDFYGGDRPGKNLFGNTLLALDAETGERIWHFQVVHHDLWDYDIPAPPNLVRVTHDGETVDAVAQITKTGYVYLFDRETGKPLFDVEERGVPASNLVGEQAYPTQPIPVQPPPFSRQGFTEDDITDLSAVAQTYVKEQLEGKRYGSHFIPPSLEGSIVMPMFNGGAEWGGASFDPTTGMLYVNANDKPANFEVQRVEASGNTGGELVYQTYCATCHGPNLTGRGSSPALTDLAARMSESQVAEIITEGPGEMPGFSNLSEDEVDAVTGFMLGREVAAGDEEVEVDHPYPYTHTGWNRFNDPDGYPAAKPPWGTMNAINLNTGEIEWKVPLGSYEELNQRGIPKTGTENYGGSVVTAGGLVFIGAARDENFRAFDKATGELLWSQELPAGGYATPITYEAGGRQFILIAAGGGGRGGTKASDTYVAFALHSGDG
jgi:quinoprotein glucose dehydrogenase